MSNHSDEYWKARVLELEDVYEDVTRALELIPIEALERGQTWIPSEVAIRLIKKAQASVVDYGHDHRHIGKGSSV